MRQTLTRVQCIECLEDAPAVLRGWRALITQDPDDPNEPAEVAVYCPDCAEREFGEA